MIMNAKQRLEDYLFKHPDYWEYENELKVVQRLKEMCQEEIGICVNSDGE